MFTKLRMLFVLASFALVTGCAGLPGGGFNAESPAQAIFAVKSGYVTALKAAVTYKELAPCSVSTKVVCSDAKVVAQIQKADILAFTAINTAQAAVDTIGGSSATTAVGAAKAALTALMTVLNKRE